MTILALAIAYVAVVLFLLLLSLKVPYNGHIKTGIILICSAFYGVVWHMLPRLEGWPTDRSLPDEFQLVSYHIIHPDKYRNTQGTIHMWVIDLAEDADRTPRAYKLPYAEQLHEDITVATGSGEAQKGSRIKRQTGDGTQGEPSGHIRFQPMPTNRPPPKD